MSSSAVFTNVYRVKYGNLASGSITGALATMKLATFRVGEGGSTTPPEPDQPDPALTQLEADGNAGYLSFSKAFGVTDVVHAPSGTLSITCQMDLVEPGLDGQGLRNGSDPHLYEVGVFDQDGDMIVYGTYTEHIKTVGTGFLLQIGLTF